MNPGDMCRCFSVATVYSCMVTFLGTVYIVNKKSILSLATTAAGAIVNVILSFILISYFGVNGAAFAMFASYFVVFLLRAYDTKRFIHMRVGGLRLTVNTILLLGQAFYYGHGDSLLDSYRNCSHASHYSAKYRRTSGCC